MRKLLTSNVLWPNARPESTKEGTGGNTRAHTHNMRKQTAEKRDKHRSLGNGVRNRYPYQQCGVDTEILYRLFSLIICSGESVEAEFSLGDQFLSSAGTGRNWAL